jgi:cellulose synthase/poly-beta-1,6-N-acetylglucosamine synthase-like glycosyltransferase
MELVVRITRSMRDRGIPFTVQYAYAANCWTEVPSTMKVLARQRDRWQRGLLDILTYHRGAAFNPRYGAMGLVGFPYYLVFEAIGPLFEVQALALGPFAAFCGSAGLEALSFAFAASVGLGVALSISSLATSESSRRFFSAGDRLRLALAAVVENFGFRQWMSLTRVTGFINALRGKTGWGRMTRSGFGRKRPLGPKGGES